MRPVRPLPRAAAASLALALVVLGSPRAARADLDEYLAKPEPAFRWEKKGEPTTVNGCKVHDLFLVSQEWQGKAWEHRLVVIRPEKLDFPGFCTIHNGGGKGGNGDILAGTEIAKRSGATFAMLFGNPSQPLWNKKEDALVVHTWLAFMDSMRKDGKGDESWPLHFPMAKAVVKGMDVVQALAKDQGYAPIDGFLVGGASKRGWTTWLVGASKDPRVKAIVPMVIDVLNVAKQGPHMLEAYGKPSEQIKDYTVADIGTLLSTKEGRRLMELEDPYSYLDRLTLPKLILNGTNDRYWTQDALNLYWDDLKGPKWVLYVPNSGHKLEDHARVIATVSAYARTIAKGELLPKLSWKYEPTTTGATLAVTSDAPLAEVRLFKAAAPTQDFRDSKWDFTKVEPSDGRYQLEFSTPSSGCLAVFAEAVFESEGARYTLSTQIKILGVPGPIATKPATPGTPATPGAPAAPAAPSPAPVTPAAPKKWY